MAAVWGGARSAGHHAYRGIHCELGRSTAAGWDGRERRRREAGGGGGGGVGLVHIIAGGGWRRGASSVRSCERVPADEHGQRLKAGSLLCRQRTRTRPSEAEEHVGELSPHPYLTRIARSAKVKEERTARSSRPQSEPSVRRTKYISAHACAISELRESMRIQNGWAWLISTLLCVLLA